MRYLFILLTVMSSILFLFNSGFTADKGSLYKASDLKIGDRNHAQIFNNRLPSYFIKNQGQVDKECYYYFNANTYTLWAVKDGFIFDQIKIYDRKKEKLESTTNSILRDTSKFLLINVNPKLEIHSENLKAYKLNFFMGNEKNKWIKGVPTTKKLIYKNVYKEIDLEVKTEQGNIEYDWIIQPGGSVGDIQFTYLNVKDSNIDEQGNIKVQTNFGKFYHKSPVSYQITNEYKKIIRSKFVKIKKNTFKIWVDNYDKNKILIIDPVVLLYSNYLGGSKEDTCVDMSIDSTGAVYLTGNTLSLNFPILNAVQPIHGGGMYDAFITKLNPQGDGIEYSTFIGGSNQEYCFAITVDSTGCATITGKTVSGDFPLKLPIQQQIVGNYDMYITKINPTGDELIFSTYLGGSNVDEPVVIEVDKGDAIYVSGVTRSDNYPVKNAIFPNYTGGADVFLTKFPPSGTEIEYSTYFGGSPGDDHPGALIIDNQGVVYLAGSCAPGFPLKDPIYATHAGFHDAFLTKINPEGNEIIFSTYLGGCNEDGISGIDLDEDGNIYLVGNTNSPDFPLNNTFSQYIQGWDVFVTKINSECDQIIYSSCIGGLTDDIAQGIAVNSEGLACITGYTWFSYYPVTEIIYNNARDMQDVFFTILNQSGNDLVFSTLFGGLTSDRAYEIKVDNNNIIYIAGYTNSLNFPIIGPPLFEYPINGDVFISKFYKSFDILNINIDIKPDSFPNCINLNSKGNIPVAIFGTENFHVIDINFETVTLSDAPIKKNRNNKLMISFMDINEDGIEDVVAHFLTSMLNLSEDDTEAILTGYTINGQKFEGKDSIKIVNK